MKNLIRTTKITMFGLIFLITALVKAQIIYKDQLETIYLDKNAEEVVYTNNFSDFNSDLISANTINFKTEIKRVKENNSYLLFLSERSNLEISTTTYLKIIRKGANRSADNKTFKLFLKHNLPELINQFNKDNNLEELYIISRKNTFNGKIDALPSVL
ncbi:hypothetical protein [Aquimarina sediminis]|uniref:hypothetical protein n=1 Tax=Aquimarina sediminis TaxID=2070536 RepID=UPI000FFE4FBA|nr:hypothetical protein [Aquimarina sediminis]